MRPELTVQQRHAMHGQLSRALELLRIPALDLENRLHAALEENLLLKADAPPSWEIRIAETHQPGNAPLDDAESWHAPHAFRSGAGHSVSRQCLQSEVADPGDTPLAHDLKQQLALCSGAAGLRELCEAIVASLDDEGYLVDGLEEVIAWTPGKHTLEQARAALSLVQSLEPAGIAARDLAECLCLQLKRLPPDTTGRAVALRIARDALPLVAAGKNAALANRYGVSRNAIGDAVMRIRECNPRPGYVLGAREEQAPIPDLLLVRDGGGWRVGMNEEASVAPRLRVNEEYAQAIGARHTELKAQLHEARWLVRALAMRRKTLLRVASEIIRRQERWLSEGDEAMAPLTMRTVAEALDIHETTVSRAVAGKYMQSPQGLVSLRRFFSTALPNNGRRQSANAVQARIREMIRNEDPDRPLSDQVLVQQLAGDGVRVARRTVAKYREGMRIPPSHRRRASRSPTRRSA